MRRLPPLCIGFLVAATAVFRGEKAFRIDELAGIGGGVRGQKRMIVTEAEVVMLGNLLCIGSAICRRIFTGMCGARQKSQ
jgi:hypothetical protein